ncbi:DEAD/DEAH box helicase, partial [Schaalia georgiae F0490]
REAPACPPASGGLRDGLEDALPFALTDSQRAAIGAIDADLASPSPMQRLLQGDVGSGKTVVALAALARVVDNGHQGALVAPTEVLAEQHFASITALLEPLGGPVGVRLLTGSTPEAARRAVLEEMASPGPLIVVGTHALLQDSVDFADLALAVIDEQHRFGVAQRAALRAARADGRLVHELVMTATPIPRTIAMTVFGDLDETRMEGMPAGRAPVATHLVDASNAPWVERLWRRAREEVDSGGRVYVVCPRIDEDDAVADADDPDGPAPLASVASVAGDLRAQPALRGIGVGELTGRTPGPRKAEAMADFASGSVPVLVATTVVEVGVDVPEATLMVIIDAQQFGLSTLHQLRGRVGRSSRESLCVAVHRHGLTEAGERRLRAFASTTDGFELAEADLRLRKEGDVLGAGQSGTATHLEHLSVRRDGAIIRDARAAAERVIDQDPSLAAHPQVMAALREQAPQALAWIHRS